ncbi:MAG: outer membrane protein assembly factor BamB family protein [Pseudomonadota bacterium]
MAEDRGLEADPRLAALAVQLPAPELNASWPQPGGQPSHAMQHLAGDGFAIAWRTNVGAGASRSGRIVASPVVADGRIFVVDAGTQLSALDAARGDPLWRFDVRPEHDAAGGAGGGVAYDRGRLYVGTGFAQVIALEAETGNEIWRQTVTAPVRAGPTVAHGRVVVISVDNQVHGLDAATGRKEWSHSGISETAGFYGNSSPAIDGNTVIATFSSGEIFALRVDTGRVLWSDSLAGVQRPDAISAFTDIRGLAVISRGQVIATSHGGRMTALDLRTGSRVWDQNVGSLYTPWLAGDFIFVTTVEAEVVCLSRRDGRIRWVQALPRFQDEKARRGRIIWTGPVLVADRLLVVNSSGEALTLSPRTGEIESRSSLPGPVLVTPVVANRTVYVLTEDAELVALR